MINWHASTCRRPDILFLDHLEVPSCLNCGEIGTVEKDTELTNAADDLPEQPSQVEFNLRWPSSLTFVDDTSTAYSLTDTISMLNVNAENIDGEQGTSGNPPESPATSLYEPLFARKIRLLRLLPGSRHEPLRCDLQTADLALKPDYEALSYTWADLKNDTSLTQRIYVGERHDVLFVTTNCANALRRLRSPRRKRTLWVDSICINQENIDERSHQVGIMQYIYTSALRVLIYLGEDPKDPNPQTSTPWMFENHGNTLDLRVDLSNQLYFTRTWMIQEIASAKSAWVMYGSRGMRWQDFLGTSDSRSHNSSRTITKNRKRLRLSHPWIKMFPKPEHRQINKLYKVILATTRCRASDPRDKVFALLGLFNDATQAGLVADYSLSTAQVFSGTTAYILQENPKAWCSVFAMANSTVSQNMPFWTVNWAVPNQLPKPKEPSTQVYLEPTDAGPTLYFAQQPFYGTNGPYNPGPGSSIQLLPGMKVLPGSSLALTMNPTC
ncbi:hypothetical protein CKAH01_04051 [Colletotrichum kahawae]|uniref:Heterokaryon incompatibility domain-containing protein n=1 Tax=Colletotrichum kahawae TaxID=34407 RepID=A0AAD9YNC0_COLKA|nr:hypothetical protein CKAH01_04051 [Colletotrichum kahawae]